MKYYQVVGEFEVGIRLHTTTGSKIGVDCPILWRCEFKICAHKMTLKMKVRVSSYIINNSCYHRCVKCQTFFLPWCSKWSCSKVSLINRVTISAPLSPLLPFSFPPLSKPDGEEPGAAAHALSARAPVVWRRDGAKDGGAGRWEGLARLLLLVRLPRLLPLIPVLLVLVLREASMFARGSNRSDEGDTGDARLLVLEEVG